YQPFLAKIYSTGINAFLLPPFAQSKAGPHYYQDTCRLLYFAYSLQVYTEVQICAKCMQGIIVARLRSGIKNSCPPYTSAVLQPVRYCRLKYCHNYLSAQ